MAATVASGCIIMLGWLPPGTCEICAFARVAIESCAAGGITRSPSPTTYHDGIDFQPSASGAFSLNALAASGRCVTAISDDIAVGTSVAKTGPKYFVLKYKS